MSNNKCVNIVSNTPVPRGGVLRETRIYEDGRTKTIIKTNFQGRFRGWSDWADSDAVPYDD